jgi:hypothetical protein
MNARCSGLPTTESGSIESDPGLALGGSYCGSRAGTGAELSGSGMGAKFPLLVVVNLGLSRPIAKGHNRVC